MRFVDCAQSWHNFDDPHRHLLLMMDFDCPLAFRHKKKGSTYLSTCRVLFSGGDIFLSLEPVEIRLYLGASLCIYIFLALDILLLGLSF